MTDTIPVPVDLLKELKASYRGSSREIDAPWDEVTTTTTLDGTAYDRVIALIPAPPKVGDVLTAEQIADLPSASVMRDEDGDVLVKVGDGVRRVTMDLRYPDSATWSAANAPGLLRVYTLTLVSLPASD